MPDESSFVAAARDSIPQATVTTAMTRGRGTSKTRGPGRGQADTQAIGVGQAVIQGTGVGKGRRGKKRSVESTSSDPASEAAAIEVQITQNAPGAGT